MATQSQKPDLSTLSEEDKAFYQKYGRLPPPKKELLSHRMKGDRKYFDSGDYALSKVGKSNPTEVGTQHPSPERIPHSIPQNLKKGDVTNSPIKESSLIHEAKTEEGATDSSGAKN